MKAAYLNGKYYLAEDHDAFGWYGYEITKEAYEALKKCDISENDVDLNEYDKELYKAEVLDQ